MDLAAPDRLDNRRIEVVVEWVAPVPWAPNLPVDTTLVTPLRRDGTPHPVAPTSAAQPSPRQGGARRPLTLSFTVGTAAPDLVVLSAEVGGKWSDESAAFVRHLAKAKARSEPPVLRGRAQQACAPLVFPLSRVVIVGASGWTGCGRCDANNF